MCEADDPLPPAGALSRRRFAALGAAAGLVAALPAGATPPPLLTRRSVVIQTADGALDAFFVHPTTGAHPAAVIWPDILGLRPATEALAERLADGGNAVLVINPYYRTARAPVVEAGASFADPAVKAKVLPLKATLSAATDAVDGPAVLAWLDQQPAVDAARPAATFGYCMGGPSAVRLAAARPARVRALASFHGAGLVTAAADSPHLLLPQLQGGAHFAVAQNDDQRDPKGTATLREACAATGRPAAVEVYPADHGWCAPDSPAHHPGEADRAWAAALRLLRPAGP